MFPRPFLAICIQKQEVRFEMSELQWGWFLGSQSKREEAIYFNTPHIIFALRCTEARDHTVWQKAMSNHQELKVVITMDGYPMKSRSLEMKQDIDAFFRDTTTHLGAKDVIITVDGLICGGYSTIQDNIELVRGACAYRCTEKITKGIEGLIELNT